MKYIFLIVLLIMGGFSSSQHPIQKLPDDMRGAVSSIVSSEFMAIDSSGIVIKGHQKEGSYIYEKHYDTAGIMVYYQTVHSVSNSKKEYFYNKAGQLDHMIEIKNDTILREILNYRDDLGKIKTAIYIFGEDTSQTEYSYNEEGKLTDAIEYNTDGEIGNHYTHSYDRLGNEVGYTLTYQDKIIFNRRTVYDADSNLIEMCDIDETGNPVSCVFRKYNEQGRIIEDIEQKDGNLTRIVNMEYDEEGNQTAWKTYDEFMNMKDWTQYGYENGKKTFIKEIDGEGKISRHEAMFYDENGNHIRTEYYSFDAGKLLFAYDWKYEFDEKGNWIRKIMYMSNRPYYITEREISYYN